MGKEALPPALIVPDANRSAFGHGWESSKRGEPFASNPELVGHWKYQMWAEGWLRYRDSLIGTCEQGPVKLEAKRKRA